MKAEEKTTVDKNTEDLYSVPENPSATICANFCYVTDSNLILLEIARGQTKSTTQFNRKP